MRRYEYTAIPAPQRGDKTRGAKAPTDRFALSLGAVLNDMAAQGWDYVRAETLPSEERSGLTGRITVWHNLLIFRREVGAMDRQVVASVTAPVTAAIPSAPASAATETAPAPTPAAPPVSDLPRD